MKILHITASYKPAYIYGGPIYSISALCEALEKWEARDWNSEIPCSLPSNVEVITTLANGKEELNYPSGEVQMIDGVAVRYFKRWTKDHSHFSPALLWWFWKKAKKYDVIHIHSWWNLVSMGAVLICILKGIRPLVSPRGMLGDYTFTSGKKLFHRYIGKHLLRKCNFHATTLMEAQEIRGMVSYGLGSSFDASFDSAQDDIAQDDMLRDDISKGALTKLNWKIIDFMNADMPLKEPIQPFKQVIYNIHNVLNIPDDLPYKTRFFDGTLKLIFLSRIHQKKGIELLLTALSQITYPFELSIIGDGEANYVAYLQKECSRLHLKNKVKWLGPRYGEEKYKLLAAHDVLVLPSFNENFANVVIESLSVKTPVLVSDKVGLSTYIRDKNIGWQHQQHVDSLRIALEKIPQELKEKQESLKEFSYLSPVKHYIDMYHAL